MSDGRFFHMLLRIDNVKLAKYKYYVKNNNMSEGVLEFFNFLTP